MLQQLAHVMIAFDHPDRLWLEEMEYNNDDDDPSTTRVIDCDLDMTPIG